MRGRLVGVALVAALVAGCGASGGSDPGRGGADAVSSSADTMTVWREFATCARHNGVPGLPDPVQNSEGKVVFPGYESSAAPESVRRACAHILDRLPAQAGASGAPTDIPALLRYAQCMRGHGFPDWPDPKQDGTFPAAQLPSMKTPALISAMQACDSLNPDRGGHVYGS